MQPEKKQKLQANLREVENSERFSFDLSDDPKRVELTDEERENVVQAALKAAKKRKEMQLRKAQRAEEMKKLANKQSKQLSSFDFFKLIASQGEEEFGQFNFDKENEEVVENLCLYFSQDPRFEERVGVTGDQFSFKKGIMLFGDVGCGKSSLMKFSRNNQIQYYKMVSCADVSIEYASSKNSIDVIDKYGNYSPDVSNLSRNEFMQYRAAYCFDDLGTEIISTNYGNKLDVMTAVLTKWYNSGNFHNIHMTTNLTADQIKESYGERMSSRIRQMFNIISFPEMAKDRRK